MGRLDHGSPCLGSGVTCSPKGAISPLEVVLSIQFHRSRHTGCERICDRAILLEVAAFPLCASRVRQSRPASAHLIIYRLVRDINGKVKCVAVPQLISRYGASRRGLWSFCASVWSLTHFEAVAKFLKDRGFPNSAQKYVNNLRERLQREVLWMEHAVGTLFPLILHAAQLFRNFAVIQDEYIARMACGFQYSLVTPISERT
jgi:hypothetical protein